MVRFLLMALALLSVAVHKPATPRPAAPPSRPQPVADRTEPAPQAPVPMREFRGMWVATKANIDWPSRPGLPVAQQIAELQGLLDTAVRLHLNAIILQVRPQADAFYFSALEPWSEYLTGREGQAPAPYWDPLQTAIHETHRRGLELHAWVNPFRVKSESARSPMATNHVARFHPHWMRPYGKDLWMDPGDPEVRAHSLDVIFDIVRRYNIDGLHMDDYFYPYPIRDNQGNWIPFPDDTTWEHHGRAAGFNNRGDWRRANIDRFVQDVHLGIRELKPWVKFGVSPFGIWRPGYPASVRGLDAYEVLAADSRKWLQEGWVDYLSPQLYWTLQAPQQSFSALLGWWVGQNIEYRHIWPGIAVARVGQDRDALEIQRQVELVRFQVGSTGYLLWNASSVVQNRGGVGGLLSSTQWKEPALIPASEWLGTNAPVLVDFTVRPIPNRPAVRVEWAVGQTNDLARFTLQTRQNDRWALQILPAQARGHVFAKTSDQEVPDEVRLTPIGRTGFAGNAGIWRRQTPAKP